MSMCSLDMDEARAPLAQTGATVPFLHMTKSLFRVLLR